MQLSVHCCESGDEKKLTYHASAPPAHDVILTTVWVHLVTEGIQWEFTVKRLHTTDADIVGLVFLCHILHTLFRIFRLLSSPRQQLEFLLGGRKE
jgi:hypothetical protein